MHQSQAHHGQQFAFQKRLRVELLKLAAPLILIASLISSTSCVKLSRHTQLATVSATPSATTLEAESITRVNLNTASETELETLPGVGRALAARIIEQRERYGPFRRVEHLLMVRGISDRRFRELRARLTVE